jgi:hypothetical protein
MAVGALSRARCRWTFAVPWSRSEIALWRALLLTTLSTMVLSAAPSPASAQSLLVPMDKAQTDHLKAYGLTFWCLQEPRLYPCEWLLNYRFGSFVLPDNPDVRARARAMNVVLEPIAEAALQRIYATVAEENMERISLARAPKVAVYIPPDKQPWDDAVTLAMTYAEIKYDKVWDPEVLAGKLKDYDWLHLHHVDFTGQYGKFFSAFGHEPWYRKQVATAQETAVQLGFARVQDLKGAVATEIALWVRGGGFLFAMCLAADSIDVALAARGVDIIPSQIDGTPMDPAADKKLDFADCFAFRDFHLVMNPYVTEISTINIAPDKALVSRGQTFQLFEFSAKQDPIVTMLTQDHVNAVHEFLGQTTSFRRDTLKDSAIVMGDFEGENRVKYIHGDYGKGTYTFYGGHDPEDYAHLVGAEPTDLTKHPHSPGYRLILNNVLFPAAKTKERKT